MKNDHTIYIDMENAAQKPLEQDLKRVFAALKAKGYNPIQQMMGYILSNDPAYITNHDNARQLLSKYRGDELLAEFITSYFREP